jgi:hypothetical protein
MWYGHVETVFLCTLAVVAALETPQAVYISMGQIGGTTIEIIEYLQFTFILFPLCFCVFVVLAPLRLYLLRFLKYLSIFKNAQHPEKHDNIGRELMSSDYIIGVASSDTEDNNESDQSHSDESWKGSLRIRHKKQNTREEEGRKEVKSTEE